MASSVSDTNQRMVTRIILTGFGLVLIILGFATLVAVRDKEIRRNAMASVKNHLIYAQLLNEVQAQEDILSPNWTFIIKWIFHFGGNSTLHPLLHRWIRCLIGNILVV